MFIDEGLVPQLIIPKHLTGTLKQKQNDILTHDLQIRSRLPLRTLPKQRTC
jgi:hypothetical protein